MFDLAKLATLNFDELATDLIICRIDGCINIIADTVQFRELPETVQVAVQCLTQGVSTSDQAGSQSN
jgi:hypothetical protein